jgi:O-antigen/teichoic acid export membrane protein
VAPIGLFFIGVGSAIKSMLHYNKQYFYFSLSPIIFTIVNGFLSIVIYYIHPFGESLIFSHIIGSVFSSLFLLSKIYNFGYLNGGINIVHIFTSMKKNIKFPIHTVPSSLVDGLSQSMPIYFIYQIFDDVIVASFGVVIKLAVVPMRFIFGSISSLLIKIIHDSVGTKYSVRIFVKVSVNLFFIVVVFGSFLYFFSEALVNTFLDKDWVYTGKILKIMCISMIYSAAISSLSSVLVATRRLKLGAFWQYLYFLSSVIFFYMFIEFGGADIYWFFTLLAIKEMFLYSIYYALIYYSVQKPSVR